MANFVQSDGYKWVNRGPGTDDHLAFGGHEVGLVPYLKMLVDPEAWYVNVGAHVGTWALRLAYSAKRVYAVEANPATMEILKLNIGNNGLQKRVIPVEAALWDVADVAVSFTDVNGKDTGGSTRLVTDNPNQEILTTTLDTLFPVGTAKDPRIGFIQMDVEGAEAKVLKGAADVLKFDRPNLLIELHEGHPGTDSDLRAQVYAILEANNYNYFSVKACPPEEHLICRPAESVDEFVPEVIVQKGQW